VFITERKNNNMYLVIRKKHLFDSDYFHVEHNTASASDAHSLQMAKTQEAKIKKAKEDYFVIDVTKFLDS
jgi:hypothetical protein